jgi:hypothetical protein
LQVFLESYPGADEDEDEDEEEEEGGPHHARLVGCFVGDTPQAAFNRTESHAH